MSKNLKCLALIMLIATLTATAAVASGGSSSPAPTAQTPQSEISPEEQARQHYNQGLYYRDKAWKLEKQLETATTDKQRDKLNKKIAKNYRMAMGEFEDALRNSPEMYQASSSLGYALRKTGDYTQSLEAYDHALSIEPGYTEAIEYRAETYLALGQLEDAKTAYVQLFGSDRSKSDELLRAMQMWLEQQNGGQSEVPPSILENFAEWVDERAEIAGMTTPVSELRDQSW
jgi:tetratricopeptide (TPR) repeat protein